MPYMANSHPQEAESPSSKSTDMPETEMRTTRRTFRSLALGVQGLMRTRAIIDENLLSDFDPSDLLLRITIALATPSSFTIAADKLFDMFSASEGGQVFFNTENLPAVLNHWQIPKEHLSLFWALIRKQSNDDRVLPRVINKNCFRAVFIKALRRLRDRYNPHGKVTRGKFVTQNSRRLAEEYIIGESCGSGSYGTCFWVTHVISKRQRVCKQIPKSSVQLPGEEVPKELDALRRLDHPGINRIFEWFESEDCFELVLEAARGGDLRHVIAKHREGPEKRPNLEESFVCSITRQACEALAYMHGERVLHRDIKPANMLLTSSNLETPRLLLADFGLAEFCEATSPSLELKGTLPYMAPEVFAQAVTSRTDVWALGIVVYEMFTGVRPFKADNTMHMYSILKNTDVDFGPLREATSSEGAIRFVTRALVKKDTDRLGSLEALEDTWFAGGKPLSTKEARRTKRSIISYINASHFTKVAMNAMAAQMDTASIERLAQVFETYDLDHNGVLSAQELSSALLDMGVDPDSVVHVAESLDVNCSGGVDYSEFISALIFTQNRLLDDVLQHAFHIFDIDNDGVITLHELHLLLSGEGPLGAALPDGKSVEQVFSEIDTLHDGTISIQELRDYLRQERRHVPTCRPLLDPTQTISALLEEVVAQMGHSESEAAALAQRLKEKHWLHTVADLASLRDSEWARLDLPIHLENRLRTSLSHITGLGGRSPDSPSPRRPTPGMYGYGYGPQDDGVWQGRASLGYAVDQGYGCRPGVCPRCSASPHGKRFPRSSWGEGFGTRGSTTPRARLKPFPGSNGSTDQSVPFTDWSENSDPSSVKTPYFLEWGVSPAPKTTDARQSRHSPSHSRVPSVTIGLVPTSADTASVSPTPSENGWCQPRSARSAVPTRVGTTTPTSPAPVKRQQPVPRLVPAVHAKQSATLSPSRQMHGSPPGTWVM